LRLWLFVVILRMCLVLEAFSFVTWRLLSQNKGSNVGKEPRMDRQELETKWLEWLDRPEEIEALTSDPQEAQELAQWRRTANQIREHLVSHEPSPATDRAILAAARKHAHLATPTQQGILQKLAQWLTLWQPVVTFASLTLVVGVVYILAQQSGAPLEQTHTTVTSAKDLGAAPTLPSHAPLDERPQTLPPQATERKEPPPTDAKKQERPLPTKSLPPNEEAKPPQATGTLNTSDDSKKDGRSQNDAESFKLEQRTQQQPYLNQKGTGGGGLRRGAQSGSLTQQQTNEKQQRQDTPFYGTNHDRFNNTRNHQSGRENLPVEQKKSNPPQAPVQGFGRQGQQGITPGQEGRSKLTSWLSSLFGSRRQKEKPEASSYRPRATAPHPPKPVIAAPPKPVIEPSAPPPRAITPTPRAVTTLEKEPTPRRLEKNAPPAEPTPPLAAAPQRMEAPSQRTLDDPAPHPTEAPTKSDLPSPRAPEGDSTTPLQKRKTLARKMRKRPEMKRRPQKQKSKVAQTRRPKSQSTLPTPPPPARALAKDETLNKEAEKLDTSALSTSTKDALKRLFALIDRDRAEDAFLAFEKLNGSLVEEERKEVERLLRDYLKKQKKKSYLQRFFP
jgi:hypothetical protein